MVDDDNIAELTGTEKMRWHAAGSTIGALAAGSRDGTLDAEGLAATIHQLQQLDGDQQQFRDSSHVPEDAGPYRDALAAILMRIPDGWGRWISCGPGWYPLITTLHADLVALDPDYVVYQVKEKFGTLRYYADPHTDDDDAWDRFVALIDDAQERSATTCERCSAPAQLCVTVRGSRRWYTTLCPACIDTLAAQYHLAPQHEDSDDR